MLGFPSTMGSEIANANMLAHTPPQEFRPNFQPSMDVADETEDEFDEHIVGLSEGESRGVSASPGLRARSVAANSHRSVCSTG